MHVEPGLRGKVVPEAFFDQAVKLRDEARKARKEGRNWSTRNQREADRGARWNCFRAP